MNPEAEMKQTLTETYNNTREYAERLLSVFPEEEAQKVEQTYVDLQSNPSEATRLLLGLAESIFQADVDQALKVMELPAEDTVPSICALCFTAASMKFSLMPARPRILIIQAFIDKKPALSLLQKGQILAICNHLFDGLIEDLRRRGLTEAGR